MGRLLLFQPGIDEMQQATQGLNQTFFSASGCAMVLAGIFGMVGAVRIYYNWQMGRERITGEVLVLFGDFYGFSRRISRRAFRPVKPTLFYISCTIA
jgi:hypothetical protein